MLRAVQRLIVRGILSVLPQNAELRKAVALALRRGKRRIEESLFLLAGYPLEKILKLRPASRTLPDLVGAIHESPLPAGQKGIKRILTMHRGQRIGDLIVCVPFSRRLNEAYPEATITVMAPKEVEALVALDPLVSFIPDCPANVTDNARSFFQSLGEVRRGGYDLVIIFSIHASDYLFALLAGIPNRLGYNYNERGWPLSIAPRPHPSCNRSGWEYAPGNNVPHIVDFWGHLLDSAGISETTLDWAEARSRLPAAFADSWLTGSGAKGSKLVVFHPRAGIPSRSLPETKTADILRGILDVPDTKVILTGGPADSEGLRRVASSFGSRVIIASGELSLTETWAVIEKAALFIGVDTGTLHMAAASGVPTIALFGPGDPWIWGPYGQLDRVIQGDSKCVRCKREECVQTELLCMNSIKTEDVVKAALALLRARP